MDAALWLDWLRDEHQWAETDEERQALLALCDRAVAEYASVDLWLEFCQLAIGGLAAADGPARVRAVFERAITAVGLHVTKGALIWEAYREFENALCSAVQVGDSTGTPLRRPYPSRLPPHRPTCLRLTGSVLCGAGV